MGRYTPRWQTTTRVLVSSRGEEKRPALLKVWGIYGRRAVRIEVREIPEDLFSKGI
jgi:hypothetical protein